MSDFDEGVAFICEGATDKEFYHTILYHFLLSHPEYSIKRIQEHDTKEYCLVISNSTRSVIVKTFSVGTIIAQSSSANWFKNNCRHKYRQIEWTVFLCYDTESHKYEISQFNEGDWKALRKSLSGSKKTKVIDLAACADIEDIMLLDIDGVCRFLHVPICDTPSGRKGASKMKKLFRENGSCYHKGERAKPLIDSLDKNVIISKSTIPFNAIEEVCFK